MATSAVRARADSNEPGGGGGSYQVPKRGVASARRKKAGPRLQSLEWTHSPLSTTTVQGRRDTITSRHNGDIARLCVVVHVPLCRRDDDIEELLFVQHKVLCVQVGSHGTDDAWVPGCHTRTHTQDGDRQHCTSTLTVPQSNVEGRRQTRTTRTPRHPHRRVPSARRMAVSLRATYGSAMRREYENSDSRRGARLTNSLAVSRSLIAPSATVCGFRQ